MKLFEYQAKHQLKAHQIPIPEGMLATSYDEVRQAISDFDGVVIAKPQGTRSTRTVRLSKDSVDARTVDELFNADASVKYILIEELIDVSRRIYITLQTHQRLGKLSLLVSSDVDGEILQDEQLINPLLGLRDYQVRDIASSISLKKAHWRRFTEIIAATYQCYIENDASYLSLRPLALTSARDFLVLSAQMGIDNNALHRQPHFYTLRSADQPDPNELRAQQAGILYTPLGGQISCVANGTGLALALIDEMLGTDSSAFTPASLMDIGSIVQIDKIDTALRIALQDEDVQAILISLFGGVTTCDQIATRIIATYEGVPPAKPIGVRLAGINAAIGVELLRSAAIPNVYVANQMSELIPFIQTQSSD
jgi:succinyl-CoA synthetase beta subunit